MRLFKSKIQLSIIIESGKAHAKLTKTRKLEVCLGFIWAGGSVGVIFDRQSLRSNSYDHHAAIYLLLLERLRARAAVGASAAAVGVGGAGGVEGRRPSRRPSSVADQALARELHDARREHHNR